MTRDRYTSARERLIAALDVSTAEDARSLVKELTGIAGGFKVGLQLFTAAGPSIVRELVDAGHRVFLDLKFHDIPNTVALASAEAAKLGVWMFNVHACGGNEMMTRAREAAHETAERLSIDPPLILGVTVLTSERRDPEDEGPATEAIVAERATQADNAGLDGVVASAHEVSAIRGITGGRDLIIVTPGVRPEGATNDDQRRVMTPGAAVLAGADHIVVGRPILLAEDRAAEASAIVAEIEDALAARIEKP